VYIATFQVHTAVLQKVQVLWDITLWTGNSHKTFEGL
jgi:hypothetical protein